MKSFIFFSLLSLCFSCNQDRKEMGGFLVRENGSRFWYYIPLKSINTEVCIGDFKMEKFKRAIKFKAPQNVYLMENFDTLKIVKDGNGSTLYIMPIIMEYTIGKGLVASRSTFKFRLETHRTLIEFDYDERPITIKKITPLFCYERKKSDVKVCECKKSDDDTNDYLYKICSYLKSKGAISFQPCKYKVTEITEALYNGKKAIEARLNCCYLGDRAYFDPLTKELIGFAYGAE